MGGCRSHDTGPYTNLLLDQPEPISWLFFLQVVMCRLNVVLDRLGPVTCEPSQNLVANRTGLSVHTDQLTLRPAVLQVQTSHRIETA